MIGEYGLRKQEREEEDEVVPDGGAMCAEGCIEEVGCLSRGQRASPQFTRTHAADEGDCLDAGDGRARVVGDKGLLCVLVGHLGSRGEGHQCSEKPLLHPTRAHSGRSSFLLSLARGPTTSNPPRVAAAVCC